MPRSNLLNEFLYLATCIRFKSDILDIRTVTFMNQDLFKAIYGLTLLQTAVTWEIMDSSFIHPKMYKKKHLLWALRFLRHYQTKHCLSHDLNHSPDTVTKWVWYTIKCLAKLKVVSTEKIYTHFHCILYLTP